MTSVYVLISSHGVKSVRFSASMELKSVKVAATGCAGSQYLCFMELVWIEALVKMDAYLLCVTSKSMSGVDRILI